MNVHEFQAKKLLQAYQVPTSQGVTLTDIGDLDRILGQVDGPPWVVKAQIHAGGRGAGHFEGDPKGGGGVRICADKSKAKDAVVAMLGKTLITHQTGPAGRTVRNILIESAADIKKEFYLSLLVDRASSRIAIVASSEGGMDIEAVAEKTPDKICVVPIDPITGPLIFQARKVASILGVKPGMIAPMLANLYRFFVEKDCSLIEINPLVLTGDNTLIALDGKINFDDNSLYRHKDIAALRDEAEEDPTELEAAKWDLSYVRLDGDIGCMVNGAGLAMATLDILTLHGGKPANFLDVGGGATAEQVAKAFSLIISDKQVKSVLVNIFGGIMRCDTIATGIIEAARSLKLEIPLVVRLAGTNVEKGQELLKQSGLPITTASDLDQAAALAAKIGR